jgi:hypothetical protein
MKLLITTTGQIIASGDYTETATELQYSDLIVPKHVVAGYQIIDVEVPDGFTAGKYTYENGQLVPIPEITEN